MISNGTFVATPYVIHCIRMRRQSVSDYQQQLQRKKPRGKQNRKLNRQLLPNSLKMLLRYRDIPWTCRIG